MEILNIIYIAIGLGVAIGMYSHSLDVPSSLTKTQKKAAKMVASIFTGVVWPVFIAAKITQKLIN